MSITQQLKEVQRQNKACGITTKDGNKYCVKVKSMTGTTTEFYNFNSMRLLVVADRDVEEVRCGKVFN